LHRGNDLSLYGRRSLRGVGGEPEFPVDLPLGIYLSRYDLCSA